jgi:hypothetical protein
MLFSMEETSSTTAVSVSTEQRPRGNSRGPLRGRNKSKLPDACVPYIWQPGQSGNPGGRPKTKTITVAYNKLLALSPAELETFEPRTVAEMKALEMIRANGRNLVPAWKEVTDRVQGRATADDDFTPTEIFIINHIPLPKWDDTPDSPNLVAESNSVTTEDL